MSDPRLCLALSFVPSLRTPERLLLADIVPDYAALLRMKTDDFRAVAGRPLTLTSADLSGIKPAVDRMLERLEGSGIRLVDYWSQEYPPLLREIYDPPLLLYVRGELPDGRIPSVAVVGTRRPDSVAVASAFSFAAELALASVPVVSGLARGIDRAAHEGACRAGGRTVAVLGCGTDIIYPDSHRELAERILASGGALVSEYPPGTPPLRYHFPERNRIISGICRSTVVITAPAKSGSLITADYALEQGRDLFIHASGSAGRSRGDASGTERLERDGAPVVEHGSDLFSHWGWIRGSVPWVRWRRSDEGDSFSAGVRDEMDDKVLYYNGYWFSAPCAERKDA